MGGPSRINRAKHRHDKTGEQHMRKEPGRKTGQKHRIQGSGEGPKNPNVGRFDGEAVLRRGVSATEKFSGGTEEAEAEGGAVRINPGEACGSWSSGSAVIDK